MVIEGYSLEVNYVLTVSRIGLNILPQVERVLGDNKTRELIQTFWKECDQGFNKYSPDREFLIYGLTVINPLLNEVLKRALEHPTFPALCEYALKDIIDKDGYCRELRMQTESVLQSDIKDDSPKHERNIL